MDKTPIEIVMCGDSMEEIGRLDGESINLTVTSPPYDLLRDYRGKPTFSAPKLARDLLRATIDGGIACVVIQDQTRDFGKSCTSFRLAIDFVDAGWKLFETCIYHRQGVPGAWWNQRWRVDHEYIFQFLKGPRPGFFQKESLKIPAIHGGEILTGTIRRTDGGTNPILSLQPPLKCPGTVWHYATSSSEGNRLKLEHPATFPDKLASDLISAFSCPGDIVLDPFGGSGTVAVMARKMGRQFIHIDISPEYNEIARKRLDSETLQIPLAMMR